MNKRVFIERLIVAGNGVADATITFSKGVNLIAGPSDSGKSYIYQCIDYLLGSEKCPKDIPESKGYSEAFLQIRTNDNRVFTLSRNLKSPSKVNLTESEYEKHRVSTKRVLGEKNNTLNGENISEFLLGLMGVKDVFLKVNASNKIRKISFRDITQLVLIDETRIITEGSPVYLSMNNYYDFTVEKSVFRFLLTESLDNELIEVEEKKVFESRIKGKMEFIESLILSKNDAIEVLQNSKSNLSNEEINLKITTLLEKLEISTNRIEELSSKRETFFKKLQTIKSEHLHTYEILQRFYLLRDHYKNDLNRLYFILEGEFLFKQLITKDCPVCGTHMGEEHLKCLANNKENKAIGESVKIEGQKIELKLEDLNATIKTTEIENNINEELIYSLSDELELVNSELNSELLPLQRNFQSQISQLLYYSKIENEILTAQKDITNLFLDKEQLNRVLQNKSKPELAKVDLGYSVLKTFCNHVEQFLKSWKFPGLTSVEFDESHKTFDLSISNRGRNSHGKGVRALSYTAFIFGLLDYCINNAKPHTGFIVLDSPLTTYHNNQKRESGDEIAPDMQEMFFRSLTSIKEDRQVILLDNKIPPAEVAYQINYIQFSNDKNSLRKGFFPI